MESLAFEDFFTTVADEQGLERFAFKRDNQEEEVLDNIKLR